MKKSLTTAGVIIISVSLLTPTVTALANKTEVPTTPSAPAVVRQVEGVQAMDSFTLNKNEVEAASVASFPDVPKTYWGYKDIMEGVKKGYVDGLPDGTFAPDRAISRAEFIKMVVAAMNIPVAKQNPGEPWYLPYTTAARQYGLIDLDEYQDGNFTVMMNRMEMARVSVRATNKSADRDEKFMLVATENGLIMGTGNGSLNPYGTTTRAQSVTIVERVLKVRSGETLPVDERAVEAAKDFAHQELDPWGREIRTYDLPKNADDYPYILKDVPNEMYEMPYIWENGLVTAKEVSQESRYNVKDISVLVENVESYFIHILNVDYNTIDYDWAEKAVGYLSDTNKDKALSEAKSYVDWVKKNKVQVEGSLKVEPSTLHESRSSTSFRSYLEFKVISVSSDVDVRTEPLIVFNRWSSPAFYEKKGITRKFYVDIKVSPKYSSMGKISWDKYGPYTMSYLLFNSKEIG